MSDETYVTVKGRLTADPDTRFTQSGAAVSNFTVAVNARKLNRQSNEWEDKPTKFWRCNAWSQGKLARAENIADTLKKGDSVIVYGELETREYEKDGQKRTADEIRVESVGKDLTFHGQAGQVQRQSNAQQQNGQGFGSQPANDPWGQPPANQQQGQQQGGWGAPDNSEVPF